MRYRNPIFAAALAAAVLTLSAAATLAPSIAAAQACDRACLQGFVDRYIDALSRHDTSAVPVAETYKYTENGRVIELGDGFWHTAGKPIDYRDYFVDPDSGGVAAFTALSEYEGIAQMMVRLKLVNRRITEIETLVVRVGDQRWFAPENLDDFSDIYAQAVPARERATRAELVAAADAYFTAIETEGTPGFKQAPFGPGVNRYENGLRTTNVTENPIMDRHRLSPDVQLENAFYKGTMVRDRRYPIVDVERGVVLGIVMFRREGDDSSTLLLSEAFKITGGMLREIRAVMLNLPHGAASGWPSH